jgi:hypothetical protein
MKKLFLFTAAFVMSAFVFAQQKTAADAIKFQELTFDFGKIKQNVPVKHDFKFTNISNAPVVIEMATASCGCTTPVKPEGAIAQGKADKIGAGFNAVAMGPFNKTITIKVAGIDLPLTLKITGEVLTADAYAKYQAEKDKPQPAKSGS